MAKAGFRKAKLAHEAQKAFLDKPMSFERRELEEKKLEKDPFQENDTEYKNENAFGRRRRMDPLTESLGATGYYHKMRFSWLYEEIGGIKYPMEVTRYYEECKLALDIGPEDPEKAALKEQLFQEHGIKYKLLESANDMRQLAELHI